MEITNALEKCLSSDTVLSQNGQKFLENNLQANFQDYVKTLSDVVHRVTYDVQIRIAAAKMLRQALISQVDFRCIESQHRWSSMQEYIRQYIIKNLLESMENDSSRPSVIAECVAAVACAEFAVGGTRWHNLMKVIISGSLGAKCNNMSQAAALDAIGYICRDLRDWSKERDLAVTVSAEIYKSISICLRQSECKHIKLAAMNALNHALCWIVPHNMKSKCQKQDFLRLMCETAGSGNTTITMAAINCLIYILSDFYECMQEQLDEELFAIMTESMTYHNYQVSLIGTKLCRKVCYLEACLFKRPIFVEDENKCQSRKHRFFSKSRMIQVLGIIIEMLVKYEVYGEKDEDNLRDTLVHCLTSLVLCYDDSFVRMYVANFVEENVYHEDWQYRNASIRVFSSLVTDEMEDLQILLNETLRLLIEMLSDCSCEVKAAAAHVIAKVCDHVADIKVFEPHLNALLKALMRALSEKPLVAGYVCQALERFSIAVRTFDLGTNDTNIQNFYEMIPQIFGKLLNTMNRPDANNDLRLASHRALDCFLEVYSKNCYPVILKSADDVAKKLSKLQQELESVLLCTKYNHLISVLCITLKLFLKKLRPEDCRPVCFRAMNTLVHIVNTKSYDMDGLEEKVLWALTTFVKMLGHVFSHYLTPFRPCLVAHLKSPRRDSLVAAVNLTTEVCQAVGCKFYPCCDDVVPLLLNILENEETDRSLMQVTLTAVGILAQECGPQFRKFLRPVLKTVIKIQMKLDEVHMETIYYERGYNLCEMHKHFLRTYVGIIQSMKSDKKTTQNLKHLFKPCLTTMVNVIIHLAETRSYLSMYDATCMEILSNLCDHFAQIVLPQVDTQAIYHLLSCANNSKNLRSKKLSGLVSKLVQTLKTPNCLSVIS